MRMSLRLIVSLIVGISLVTCTFAFYQVRAAKQALRNDLDRRGQILAESLAESVEPYLQGALAKNLPRLVERFGNRQHLVGVAVYGAHGNPLAVTSGLQARLASVPATVSRAIVQKEGQGEFIIMGSTPMHVYVQPLFRDDTVMGALAIFHDASYIAAQSSEIWRVTFLRVLIQTVFIVLATLLIVRWSIGGPIARAAQWMREQRTGNATGRPDLPATDLIEPLMQEVTHFTRSLAAARDAAKTEARLRETAEARWTPERLHIHVKNKLGGRPLFVVSNREPYMHIRRGNLIEAMAPAGGLVLFPIRGPEGGARVGNMAERPESLIGKAVVVPFLFLLRQPNTAERILGVLGGNPQPVVFVDRFAVGVARSLGNPGAVTSAENGMERGHQATGRSDGFHRFTAANVHVGLAVGNDKKRPSSELALHVYVQPLRRP